MSGVSPNAIVAYFTGTFVRADSVTIVPSMPSMRLLDDSSRAIRMYAGGS